ncbi:MAG: hypothetical protein HC880_18435 [Bacteroidia bacterium]|nr:hypothetical protein [Bacteroidia bacterium]
MLSTLYIPVSDFIVYPTVAAINYRPAFAPSPHEVAHLLEIDLNDFMRDNKLTYGDIKARQATLQVPYYALAGQTVWGATAMILSEFLMLLEDWGIS